MVSHRRNRGISTDLVEYHRRPAFPDLDEDGRQSIARIKASPFIPKKDSVRGFVYEVESGRLREVS
jgi:hypothetical protein